MQIVIDIPENDYELALRNDYSTIYKGVHIAEAIKNGTPLPKEHGRLIDINDIEWAKHTINKYWYNEDTVVSWDVITDAPTIVEDEE